MNGVLYKGATKSGDLIRSIFRRLGVFFAVNSSENAELSIKIYQKLKYGTEIKHVENLVEINETIQTSPLEKVSVDAKYVLKNKNKINEGKNEDENFNNELDNELEN